MPVAPAGKANAVMRRRILTIWLRVALLVLFLGGWQLSSGTLIDPYFFSRPSDVMVRLWQIIVSGELARNFIATIYEGAMGYLIGGVAAIASGFILGRVKLAGNVLDPFITGFFSIPKLALAPLIILWFGIGDPSKIVLAGLLTFYQVFWNTYAGVQKVEHELIDVVRVMGASHWQLLREVIFPSSVGWILVGLRMAVPYALMGAVVGEIMAGNRGLGYMVQAAASQFDTTGVFAVLIVLAAIGSTVSAAMSYVDRRSQRWNASGQ